MKLNKLLTGAFVIASLYSASLNISRATPAYPPLGMVGWWQAEGNETETVGWHDGLPRGGVTFATGKVGQAFQLDGSSGYVEVPSDDDLKFTGPFSIEAWINFSELRSDNDCIVAKGVDADEPVDWALEVDNAGKLRVHAQLNGSWDVFSCSTTLSTNTWYHVAMVYDGSSLKGYVNGVLDGSQSASGAVHTSDDSMKIGAYAPSDVSGPDFFPGKIDELTLYNRALSASELLAIYNASADGKHQPTSAPSGLVSWWRAQRDANDLIDRNDGTFMGTAAFDNGADGQSFSLDGSSYIDVPSNDTLKYTGPFSIEAWVNYSRLTSANNCIVAKGTNADVPVDYALEISSGGKLRPHIQLDGNWYAFDCNTTLNSNTWYHVAMVYDGSQLKGFVNGALDGSENLSGTVHTSDYSFRIGAYAPSLTTNAQADFFIGKIDEVSLYNRALTTNEIQSIYDAGGAVKRLPVASPTGLVAWWPGEDDVSGVTPDVVAGHDGTVEGSMAYDSGESRWSFDLNGSTYVSVDSTNDLKFTGPFSIEAWVNYARLTSGNNCIIAKGTNVDLPVDYALEISSGGKLRPHIQLNGSWYAFDCDTVLNSNTWYHVAMVYDGSQLKGYVNGILDGSENLSGTVHTSDFPLRIGAYAPSLTTNAQADFFIGKIDEISLYNRALTAAEVNSLYIAGGAGKYLPSIILTNLVSLWRAQLNADDSIGGNNGSLEGSATYDIGKLDQAFSLDGSDSYVNVPSDDSLKFTGPFTIEGWINFDYISDSGDAIVVKGSDVDEPADYAFTVSVLDAIRPHVHLNGNWYSVDGKTSLTTNTWYHVAMVYDGSHLKGYVNGVLDVSRDLSGTVDTSDNHLKIGVYAPDDGVGFFPGRLDEISVYNRALTPLEIKDIFNAGGAGKQE